MLILQSSIIPSLSSSGWNKENLNIIRLSPLPWLAQDFPSSFPESPISGNPLPPGQSVTLPVTCQFFRLSCFTVSQWNTYMIFRTSHVLCVTCQFIHRMSFHCPKPLTPSHGSSEEHRLLCPPVYFTVVLLCLPYMLFRFTPPSHGRFWKLPLIRKHFSFSLNIP